MSRNIKAEYDGKQFKFKVEECNTIELLSFVCDVAEQALYIVAGDDTELFNESKAAVIDEIKGVNEVRHERLIQ